MSLLKTNLAALARRYPEAAARVESAGVAQKGEWAPARSGAPAVRRGGVALCSAFDPETEARRAVPEWPEADFALLPGLGAGYLAQAVAARYADLPVVVAEKDPSWFREVLEHRDLTGLWDHAVPLLGPEPEAVGAFFSRLACTSVAVLPWRPLAEQEEAWHRAAADELARAQSRAGVNAATYRRFGALWSRNLARNEAHPEGARALSGLKDRWAGFPAVIAAAGPSLSQAGDWMVKHRDRMLLIAVDTAWPALEKRGIEPDLLVVMDGQYWNGRHLDRALPERTSVVTEWTGPPRAFRAAAGRVYVAATSLALLRRRETERWGDLGALPSGGSVATAAWSLALYLGCREVAFAGLDLGYPGGTHARGSQFEETALRRAERLKPAETEGLGLRGSGLVARPAVDGGTVLSDARMDLFRSWLSDAAAARPDVRAINLSRHGSLVSGLVAAPPGYGDGWPEQTLPSGAPSRVLVPLAEAGAEPPWSALENCIRPLPDGEFVQAVHALWQEARAYWGPSWDTWAGRERAAWDQFPSLRTRRRLVELAELTLSWRRFWSSR